MVFGHSVDPWGIGFLAWNKKKVIGLINAFMLKSSLRCKLGMHEFLRYFLLAIV